MKETHAPCLIMHPKNFAYIELMLN